MPPKNDFWTWFVVIVTLLNLFFFIFRADIIAGIIGGCLLFLNWNTFRYLYYRYIRFWK
jgi:hypothetical protein